MIIKKLELNNFRNYDTLDIELSEGINILYGDNAQGKTNILEAIYLSCTTKALRAGKERELIRFGEDEAHIRMYFSRNSIDRRIDMHLKKNKAKGVAIDGIPVAKSSEIYGMMNIISFSPDDLSIIKSGPAERRRFIDMELCQLDRAYMYNLAGYNKTLVQRNILLKQLQSNRELESTLQVWDEQLIKYGTYIIGKREAFIRELSVIAAEIHNKLTDGEESLELIYAPDSGVDDLAVKLAMNHEKDYLLKVTGVGPHRDDLEFKINGTDSRKFGSQGQQRTVALTLKLSEIELVKKKVNDNPILLLDDVLSELDRNRQTQLLDSIDQIQTVITCTGLQEFVSDRVKYNKIYKVSKGTVSDYDLVEADRVGGTE